MAHKFATYEIEDDLKSKGYKHIIGVDEVGRGCEHKNAEVLTTEGWKYYTEIDVKTDKVLSYTDTGNIVWQSPDCVIEQDFEGDLIELKNRSVHILVTPDHCFDVLSRTFKRDKNNNNRLKMTGYAFRGRKSVNDLVDNDFIPRGGVWEGEKVENFILPAIPKNKYNNSSKDYFEKSIPMTLWVSFMGIYLAEGYTLCDENNGNYKVVIPQMEYSDHYGCIESLLKQLPFDVKTNARGFSIYDKQLAVYMKQFGDVYSKHIPYYVKNLSIDLLNIFIVWAIKGDGACYTNKNKQQVCVYYTSSIKLKDDFEELLLKAGWTYKTSFREPSDIYIHRKLVKKENQKGCFEIRLRRNNKIACTFLHKSLVSYNGKVFCLSLPKYHNFYVRRNGTGYFTGNCGSGPVVACAVYIPEENIPKFIGRVKDSKQLSEKQRIDIVLELSNKCEYALGIIGNSIIDKINILQATKKAMKLAIDKVPIEYKDYALIDGTAVLDDLGIPQQAIIKGDTKSISIAMASIIAKVERDSIMQQMHTYYPHYQWDKNKGYLTKAHIKAIQQYGVTEFHRRSFNKVG